MPKSFLLNISLNIGFDPEKRSFVSLSEFRLWIETELSKWNEEEENVVSHLQIARFKDLLVSVEQLEAAQDRNAFDNLKRNFIRNKINFRFLEHDANSTTYLLSHSLKDKHFDEYYNNLVNNLSTFSTANMASNYEHRMNFKLIMLDVFDEYPQPKVFSRNQQTAEELSRYIRNLEEESSTWRNETETHLSKFDNDAKNLLQSKVAEHKKSIAEHTQKFEELHKKIEKQFEDTDIFYREQLMLQGPADYWEKQTTKYRNKGQRWIWASIGLSAVIITMVTLFIIFLPTSFINLETNEITGTSSIHLTAFLRTVVLAGVGLSVTIYLLRIFVKMILSSYHIATDAEERKTLAYLYLALLKENKIDSKQASIVYSALFSRTDTGLLKGDSSPSIVSPLNAIQGLLHQEQN